MSPRPPRFWSRPGPSVAASLLSPLAALYAGATARRGARPGHRLPVPVICVGNVSAGGTGKTPTVIALCRRIAARGRSAHVVSRGHGGRARGPLTVEPGHTAAEVGDEPLLIARVAPVHVARDRAAGGRRAVAHGAEVVVLDDGHQNPSLVKDLSVVVVDAEVGFGNERVIPAGPLREPVAAGLARADMVVLVGSVETRRAWHLPVPVIGARLVPRGDGWDGRRVLAVAGIGRPERFFATLRAVGAVVVAEVALRDHQPITPRMLARLERRAQALGAEVACTEKDLMRLPPEDRGRVRALPVRLEVEDWGAVDEALGRLGL